MPTVTLTRGQTGRLEGLTEKDQRQYALFRSTLKGMDLGHTMAFTFKLPRCPLFHRNHFRILKLVFDNQEAFSDFDGFRKWGEVGGGYFDEVPGPDGKTVALPKSIDYLSLDEAEFREVHRVVMDFLRSSYALGYLWPAVEQASAWAAVDNLITGDWR